MRKIGDGVVWSIMALLPIAIMLYVLSIPLEPINIIITWMLWILIYVLAVQGDPIGTPIRLAFLKPGIGWGVTFGVFGGFITGIGTWNIYGLITAFITSILVKYAWLWAYNRYALPTTSQKRGEGVVE